MRTSRIWLLSRAASRQKEIAVRTALGAGRGRLIRQLLTESLLLSVLGGTAGVLAASWAVHATSAVLPQNVLPICNIDVDSTVMLFAIAITLATGLMFGLAPAWQTAKTDLNTVLKQGGRCSIGSARPVLRKALIAGELALATILLIGSGLLMQRLLRLQQVRLGFRPDHLLTFQLSPSPAKYPGVVKSWAFYRAFLDAVRSLPGVRGATVSSGIPFGAGNYNSTPAYPVGKSLLPPGEAIPIDWRNISPGYFRTMEIPFSSGRDFDGHDGPDAPAVMIVSQKTVEKLWGNADPLGRLIRLGNGKEYTVVGVVGDARNTALSQDPAPAMYIPAPFRVQSVMDLAVRTEGDPNAALAGIRHKLHELDVEMPISNVRTMDQWVSNNAARPRLNTVLLEVFAVIALLIAAIGIYGVLSYSVDQRTREIGVRIAMGAQRGHVLKLVVAEGMLIAAAGIGTGLIGALAVSRALASLLFGVAARDLTTFAAVTVVLAAIAAVACYVPAMRATRVDPIVALRYE